jgi:hypothetical protein
MSKRERAATRAGAAIASLDTILAGVRDYQKTAKQIRGYRKILVYGDSFMRRLLVQRTRLYNVLVDILEEQVSASGMNERMQRNLSFRLGIFVGPFTDSICDVLDCIRNHPQLTQIIAYVEEVRKRSVPSVSTPLIPLLIYSIPSIFRTLENQLTCTAVC